LRRSTPGNPAASRCTTKFGFVHVGRMRELGWKFDRWLDVIYMQLIL
jgi:phosphinothricin acetyltransferase